MKEQSNYSFETSHKPYKENIAFHKQRQCDLILGIAKRGANNLLQISQVSGIPQAIVSARASDLINEGKIVYEGHVVFNNRLRKKIVITQPPVISFGKQVELF